MSIPSAYLPLLCHGNLTVYYRSHKEEIGQLVGYKEGQEVIVRVKTKNGPKLPNPLHLDSAKIALSGCSLTFDGNAIIISNKNYKTLTRRLDEQFRKTHVNAQRLLILAQSFFVRFLPPKDRAYQLSLEQYHEICGLLHEEKDVDSLHFAILDLIHQCHILCEKNDLPQALLYYYEALFTWQKYCQTKVGHDEFETSRLNENFTKEISELLSALESEKKYSQHKLSTLIAPLKSILKIREEIDELDDTDAGLLIALSTFQRMEGQLDEAISSTRKAIEILEGYAVDADTIKSHHYLGELYLQQKEYENALFFFNQSSKLMNELLKKDSSKTADFFDLAKIDQKIYLSLATTYLILEQYEAAALYFEEGIRNCTNVFGKNSSETEQISVEYFKSVVNVSLKAKGLFKSGLDALKNQDLKSATDLLTKAHNIAKNFLPLDKKMLNDLEEALTQIKGI